MSYKWVEKYTNMVHSEQNMSFLKLDIYVVAASNTSVEIIDFFDLRKSKTHLNNRTKNAGDCKLIGQRIDN